MDPKAIGFNDRDLSNAIILDHLTPKPQERLCEAKRFKARYNYAYCWAKNQVINLWQAEDSRPIRVKDLSVLHRLAQEIVFGDCLTVNPISANSCHTYK